MSCVNHQPCDDCKAAFESADRDPPCDTCRPLDDDYARPVLNLFVHCINQLIFLPDGSPVSISIPAVESVMRIFDLTDMDIFSVIMKMGDAYCEAVRFKQDRENESEE